MIFILQSKEMFRVSKMRYAFERTHVGAKKPLLNADSNEI